MVEARRPEAVSQLLVEPLVLAQDDPCKDRPALSGRDRLQRARNTSAQPVRDSAQATAVADHAEAPSPQHDVNALPTQVGRLVEATLGLGASRAPNRDDDLQLRSLRGRPLRRQVETGTLVELDATETQDANGNADRELAPARRSRHLHARERSSPDLLLEHACVEGRQPHAAPPEPCEDEGDDEQDGSCRRDEDGDQRGPGGGEREPGVGLAAEEGKREARAERGGEKVRRRHPPEEIDGHGSVTAPRAA